MRLRPTLATLAAALLFVAASSFAVRATVRARAAADTAENLRRENVLRRARATEAAPSQLSPIKPSAPPAVATSAAPAPPSTATPPDELEALHQRALETSAQLSLARFVRLRALPSDQAAALTRLVARHQLLRERLSADPAAAKGPSDPAAPAYRERWATARADEHADLTALLGPDGVDAYEHYQQSQPLWTQVRALATQLYDTPTPLTPTQAESLMNILVSDATTADGKLQSSVADWNLVFAQAEPLLSPPQLAAFKASQESIELILQLNRAQLRARNAKK